MLIAARKEEQRRAATAARRRRRHLSRSDRRRAPQRHRAPGGRSPACCASSVPMSSWPTTPGAATASIPTTAHAGFIVTDSIVAARDPHFFADQDLTPHRPSALLLWEADEPNHVEDVTDFVETKIAALLAHESQFQSTMGIDEGAVERVRGVHRAAYGTSCASTERSPTCLTARAFTSSPTSKPRNCKVGGPKAPDLTRSRRN